MGLSHIWLPTKSLACQITSNNYLVHPLPPTPLTVSFIIFHLPRDDITPIFLAAYCKNEEQHQRSTPLFFPLTVYMSTNGPNRNFDISNIFHYCLKPYFIKYLLASIDLRGCFQIPSVEYLWRNLYFWLQNIWISLWNMYMPTLFSPFYSKARF